MRAPVVVNAVTRGASAPTRLRQFYAGAMTIGYALTRNRTFWPFVAGSSSAAPGVTQASSYAGPLVDSESILALDAAWSCVWRYANTISTLPLPLMKVGEKNTGTRARDHALYSILTVSPDGRTTAAAFWQAMVLGMQLWGNSYARILRTREGGPIVGLKLLRPEHMTPYITAAGDVRYRYTLPGMEPQDLGRSEVFHLFDRTADGLVGLSRIQYGRQVLGLGMSAERAAGLGYRAGMRATGIVKIASWLTKEKREAYRDEVQSFMAPTEGGGSGRSLMVLENGSDFQPINMKHADVELLESRRFSVEQICRMWDVPPVLVHHAAAGVTQWGTGVSAIILGWQKTGLAPVLTMIEQAINLQLLTPAERVKYYAQFHMDGLLRGSPAERLAQYSTGVTNGIYLRDEVRAWEDLPPIAGGDIATVQSAMVSLESLGQNAQPEAQQLRNALHAFLAASANSTTEPAT